MTSKRNPVFRKLPAGWVYSGYSKGGYRFSMYRGKRNISGLRATVHLKENSAVLKWKSPDGWKEKEVTMQSTAYRDKVLNWMRSISELITE